MTKFQHIMGSLSAKYWCILLHNSSSDGNFSEDSKYGLRLSVSHQGGTGDAKTWPRESPSPGGYKTAGSKTISLLISSRTRDGSHSIQLVELNWLVPLKALQVVWLVNRSQKRGRPPPLLDPGYHDIHRNGWSSNLKKNIVCMWFRTPPQMPDGHGKLLRSKLEKWYQIFVLVLVALARIPRDCRSDDFTKTKIVGFLVE